MVEGLMEAYHLPLHEIMRLTVPQIIMLNHGAWYNRKRLEASIEESRSKGNIEQEKLYNGKPIEDQNSDAWASYFSHWE